MSFRMVRYLLRSQKRAEAEKVRKLKVQVKIEERHGYKELDQILRPLTLPPEV